MCEEVCIAPGEEDDTSQAMDHDIKKIAQSDSVMEIRGILTE